MTRNEELEWHDVRQAPFSLYGLYKPDQEAYFHRLPEDVAAAVSAKVSELEQECAGGRVRFSTDSASIAIRVKFRHISRAVYLTLIACAGFDLYTDGPFGSRFIRYFDMPYDVSDEYEKRIALPEDMLCREKRMRAFTVHFPYRGAVETLEIGVEKGAELGVGAPYRDLLPIVFYGSSIVHGYSASRPGLIYENHISRRLNMDYVNLGFGGAALGETALARYMAGLPMSVFVADYDHNAPNEQHLRKTVYPLYEIIRGSNPSVPYIMISRPNYYTAEYRKAVLNRRDEIMLAYLRARKTGDNNVYFVDGMSFFADENMYASTMDHTHPNDYGFLRMADSIGAAIRMALDN